MPTRPLLLALLGASQVALAGSTAIQDVQVTTHTIAEVSVSGNESITISDTSAHVVSTTTLDLSTNSTSMKITVQSDLTPSQPLKMNVSGFSCPGTPAAAWTITASTTWDLLTGIPRGTGNCLINFYVDPDMTVAPGTEIVRLTYTITS